MKITKKILAFFVAIALAFSVFAQDDDFGGSDDFGSDDFDSFDSGESEESPFRFGGDISVGARVYVDQREEEDNNTTLSFSNWKTWAMPSAKLDIGYTGSRSAFSARLKFDKNSLGDYKWDILDEFTATAFIGNFQIEAGKMRIVWGKGDKLHVLDNFNANDYTDYIIPDYLDRRISETMFHLVYTTNSNVKIEAVYTPWMTPDRLGSGVWTPKASRTLTNAVEAGIKERLAAADKKAVTAKTTLGVVNGLAANFNGAAAEAMTAKANYEKAQAGAAEFTATYTAALTAVGGDATKLPAATQAQFATKKAEIETLVQQATIAAVAAGENFNAAKTAFETAVKKSNPDFTLGDDSTKYEAIINSVLENSQNAATAAETDFLLTLTSASGFSAGNIYPDTYKLKYGQAGARVTFTAGPVDLGFSYYFGRNKQPSVNKQLLATFGGDTSKITGGKLLDYDQLQVFGFEGAYVIPGVGLNTRWEFAYNLTKDIAGDDPSVANNSIAWVVGFDRDIPLHNININIQTQGKVVLKHDKINDMGALKVFDVDYVRKNDDGDGLYTNNKLVFNITDTWNYEKIKLDLKVIWGIERSDLLVMPTLTFNLADSFNLDLSGLFIWCKNEYSEFDGWEHNSFGQIACKYKF